MRLNRALEDVEKYKGENYKGALHWPLIGCQVNRILVFVGCQRSGEQNTGLCWLSEVR